MITFVSFLHFYYTLISLGEVLWMEFAWNPWNVLDRPPTVLEGDLLPFPISCDIVLVEGRPEHKAILRLSQ